jgi:hypothetical protein
LTYQPPFGPNQQPPAYRPPQQYTPQAGYPMQPPRKKRKWPWIVGGFALVSILAGVALFILVLGGTAKVTGNNQSGENAVAGKMNTPATDGKFQFTVTGLKCGALSVGDAVQSQKAQGQFCIVDVNVKNVGQTAEIFTDSSQKGYDENDTEYSVASGGAIYANKDYSTFLEQISPGNTVKGKLAFDVPTGTKLSYVVLHESMYTAGVKIPLT